MDDKGKTTNEKFNVTVQTKCDRTGTRIMVNWWNEHIQVVLAILAQDLR